MAATTRTRFKWTPRPASSQVADPCAGSNAHVYVLLLLLIGALSLGCGTPAYDGDGELVRIKSFPASAYELRLPSFDLSQKYTATYTIRGLPESNYEYLVGISLQPGPGRHMPRYGATSDYPGTIAFELSGPSGSRHLRCTMNEVYWMWLEGDPPFGFPPIVGPEGAEFYQGHNHYDSLRVSYEPGRGSPSIPARVVIKGNTFRL